MGTISENFSYKEFEVTDDPKFQGGPNVITSAAVRDSVQALVETVLQPLRDAWGEPLSINSGYRCPELNAAVGGVPTSQHVRGEAADVCPSARRNDDVSLDSVFALAEMAKNLALPFDQMILYPHFVHISHRLIGPQRGQILYNRTWNGKKL